MAPENASTHRAPVAGAHCDDAPGDHDHDHEAHGHGGGGHDDHDHGPAERHETILLAVAAVAIVVGHVLDLWGAGIGAPDWSARATFAIAILATLPLILPEAWEGIVRERTLGIGALVTVATAGAVFLGDWPEGATVAFLFVLGEAIEGYAFASTRRSVSSLLDIAPATATVIGDDGAPREVPVREISPGMHVAVRPGERIPVDGIVLAGASSINQAALTGESLPVERGIGDEVLAGTMNVDGYLEVSVTRIADDTAVAMIVRVAGSALSGTTRNQRLVQRFARWYTPTVIALAIAVGVVAPLVLGEPVADWFGRALILVLVACPCALLMAAPVAIVAAVGNASRHGVVIRTAAALEAAGTVDAVAFDKTGTLTHGLLEVTEVLPVHGDRDGLLRIAAAVEARSEHPVAAAIVRAASAPFDGAAVAPFAGAAIEEFRAVAGSGVVATVNGLAVVIGRPEWVAGQGVDLDPVRADVARLEGAGHRCVVVASTDDADASLQVWGTIGVADHVRAEAAEAVAAVRGAGRRHVLLVTGDAEPAAHAIAAATGIDVRDVRGALSPTGKVEAVRDLAARPGVRSVAMVGDGINDAPALAVAGVGIAMGRGSAAIARDMADLVIVADDLRRVGWFLDLASQTRRVIRANVAMAIGVKAIVLVLGAAGLANLWLAIATDTGATVLVALNGIRLLGWGRAGRAPSLARVAPVPA